LSAVCAPEGATVHRDHSFFDAQLIDQQLAGPIVRSADNNISLRHELPDRLLGFISHHDRMSPYNGLGILFVDEIAHDINLVTPDLRDAAGMANDISDR